MNNLIKDILSKLILKVYNQTNRLQTKMRQMQIITPHFIYFKDRISTNLSIAYDKTIEKIAPIEELRALFPDAKVTTLRENSLLMPGLINAHVHIEFSANKTHLSYGDFMTWLYSVII